MSHPGNKIPLRRGKWTSEEEAYVARVIRDFNAGYLAAPAGTTLRSYLSDKLHCDPMRITKKFTGDACIGKRVFHPVERDGTTGPVIDRAQADIRLLEERWRQRLLIQQKESAKKSCVAANGRHQFHSALGLQPHQHSLLLPNGAAPPPPGCTSEVTHTATWLDRADAILARPPDEDGPDVSDEVRLKEVRKLIHEGSEIVSCGGAVGAIVRQARASSTAVAATVGFVLPVKEVSAAFGAVSQHIGGFDHSRTNSGEMMPVALKNGHNTAEQRPLLQEKKKLRDAAVNSAFGVPRQIQEDGRTKKPRTSFLGSGGGGGGTTSAYQTLSSLASGSDAEALVGFLNSVRSQAK